MRILNYREKRTGQVFVDDSLETEEIAPDVGLGSLFPSRVGQEVKLTSRYSAEPREEEGRAPFVEPRFSSVLLSLSRQSLPLIIAIRAEKNSESKDVFCVPF